MTILAAKVSPVQIGFLEVEGLLLETGEFAVALQQVADLFSVPQNNAQRDFKTLLGEGFQFLKINAKRAERQNRSENALTIVDFERLLAKLDRKGNQKAQDLRDTLVGLSLQQLFNDAFGIKFEKDDRQAWLKSRMTAIATRRTLTDSIKDYCLRNDESDGYNRFIYSNVSDRLNRALFGKTAKQLKEERGLPENSQLRDYHDEKSLHKIEHVEANAMLLIDKRGMEPMEAMKQAIALYL